MTEREQEILQESLNRVKRHLEEAEYKARIIYEYAQKMAAWVREGMSEEHRASVREQTRRLDELMAGQRECMCDDCGRHTQPPAMA